LDALHPEAILPRTPRSPFYFTCEHASNAVPDEFTLAAADKPWMDTHWAWDPGAAMVTRAMASRFGSGAILAKASRLICDVNRKIGGPGFILSDVEGSPLSFNQGVDEVETERRVERYYLPYHRALHDRLQDRLSEGQPPLLLAVHSFTPVMDDKVREMEIAVVFDGQCPDKAHTFIESFRSQGLKVGVNKPYSGIKGQMYSAWYHGKGCGMDYLELEMRQDFFKTREGAHAMTEAVAKALESLL
jgi:predicted N-formylglutamate amidohydrolase